MCNEREKRPGGSIKTAEPGLQMESILLYGCYAQGCVSLHSNVRGLKGIGELNHGGEFASMEVKRSEGTVLFVIKTT